MPVSRLLPLFVTAVLLVSLCAPVVAQTGLAGISRSVRSLDKNFDIADKNHDGKLSREEAQAGPVPFIARNFDAIDAKQTGLVSKEDVHAYIAQMLMRSQPSGASSPAKPG
jgi:hypothetical protein